MSMGIFETRVALASLEAAQTWVGQMVGKCAAVRR